MTTASMINLKPVTEFLNELFHAMGRPAVFIQIVCIILCLTIGWILASKNKFNLKFFKPPINRRAKSAAVSLVLLVLTNAGMDILKRPSGLIQDVEMFTLYFLILSLSFQILIQSINKSKSLVVRRYKNRLFIKF